jgi:hypothetical protein
VLRYVNVPFNYPVEVVIGAGLDAPIDTRADGMDVRLRLLSCVGYPGACTPTSINDNFANATAFNGVATLAGLVIGNAGQDRYFVIITPTPVGVTGGTSEVFDVEIDPYVFSDGFESL